MSENNNQIQLIGDSIDDLKQLVTDSLNMQTEVSPIYKSIINKILAMIDKEDELSAWEPKDLLKLLDLSNKANLQPIDQLTKLIQSIQALQETTRMQEKMGELSDLVNEIKETKKGIVDKAEKEGIDISEIVDAEVVEDEEE